DGSPKVAAPIATARTKCRRLNLPSRRPLQHAQEASRRTTCNVVTVPLLAWSHAHRTFAESCPFTLILHMCRRQKYATVSGDVSGSSAARSSPCATPPRASGGESRQSATHDERARMIGRCLRGAGNLYR